MNKLIIFGDSNSLPFFGNNIESEKYKIFKGGDLPKGWMEILSDKLSMQLINYSQMGFSNSEIFQTICNNIDKIKKNDCVIIGWTFRMRFQVVSQFEKTKETDDECFRFTNVLPSYLPEYSLLSKNAMNEFLVHKNHPYWVNEIYIWEKLLLYISNIASFKIFFWSMDDEIGRSYFENSNKKYYLGKEYLVDYYYSENYKKLNINSQINSYLELTKYGFWKHLELLGMKQISEETNGFVNDGHIDENGHKIIADLFYYQMLNNGKMV